MTRPSRRWILQLIGYGSVARPFNEAFGIIKEVHWGGKAIKIESSDGFKPLATATCPSLLRQRGSWCAWVYGTLTGSFTQADGFYGITDNAGTFAADINLGDADPTWLDPGIGAISYGMFPRGRWEDDDNTVKWTIRPDDSITDVHVTDGDPDDFYWRDDTSDMDFDKWHLVMMSWDVSTGFKTIVIDDVVKTVVYEPEPFTGFWDGSTRQDDTSAIPSAPDKIALFVGEGRHWNWWLSTEKIDFTILANRRRFIGADKKPVAIGSNGSLGSPTSRQPEFFFTGSTLTTFSNNRGSQSGAVVWTSQLGLSTSTPVDPTWSGVAKPVTAGM